MILPSALKGPALSTECVPLCLSCETAYELNADKSTFSANGTKGDIHEPLDSLDIKTYYYQGKTDQQTAGNISRWGPRGRTGSSRCMSACYD